jgi:hypothetical protein
MRGLRMLAAVFVVVFAAQACAHAQVPKKAGARQPTAERRAEEVRRLVEATGLVARELESIEPLLARMREQSPQIPEKVWKEVQAEFRNGFTRETVIEMYAPVYSRHFAPDEIRRLLAFYNSPLGKKLVAETPLIETELFVEGVRRGINIGEKIRQLLKARGYDAPIT